MTRITLRAIGLTAILSALVLSLNLIVGAQQPDKPNPPSSPAQSDKSKASGQDSKPADQPQDMSQVNKSADAKSDMFSARLLDAEKKAQNKEATVEVMVKGVNLVDPATTDGMVKKDQGHIHYQVDNGPVIATPA